VDAAERHDARDPAARPDDHLAADLLAQDPVRRADSVPALRRHGGCFQSEAVLSDRCRSLVHDRVTRLAPVLEREVEAGQVEREPDHVGGDDPQRLFEQLLARLVALEDDDRLKLHRRRRLA